MFTHKPMWVVWLMKMGDCEPSYGYGKAHVVSGHWFSPWHTGREPDLSNPFQGLFSRMPCGAKGSRLTVGVWGPGVCSPAVSAHVRARTLWQGRWGTVPKGVRGGKKGEGCRRGSRGERGGGGGKGIRVRGLSCFWPGFLRGFLRGFWLFLPPPWTVQNGSGVFRPEKGMKNLRKNSRNNPCKGFWTVQNGSGVFPPEKGMKNLRKNSRKNSRNNPCKGFWTVQGFPPYHVKSSRWPVGSRVPMLARTNLPEKFDGFPFAGFSWYAGWVGL